MNKYLIRFNKSRGQPNRGTELHVWRVFENETEILARHVRIQVPSWSEADGPDWNIACKGRLIWVDNVAVIVTDKD